MCYERVDPRPRPTTHRMQHEEALKAIAVLCSASNRRLNRVPVLGAVGTVTDSPSKVNVDRYNVITLIQFH